MPNVERRLGSKIATPLLVVDQGQPGALMSGIDDLVPLAELLAVLSGGRSAATEAAAGIMKRGEGSLLLAYDDLHIAARHELVRTGVVDGTGHPNLGRAAELVSVCQVLAMAATPVTSPVHEPRIVLSAPPGTVQLSDVERLDGLVLDVIRRATSSLVIGGPYWNDAGFERLNDVLIPAVSLRDVDVTLFLNPLEQGHQETLEGRISELQRAGPLRVRWFVGPRPTMLHAKFVIRDGEHGYLGTANLTSWGMAGHIEAGVELMPGQCRRFVEFLAQLEEAGLFADRPSW
jgi:hypothetical protein